MLPRGKITYSFLKWFEVQKQRETKKKKKIASALTFLDPAQSEFLKLAFQRDLELLPIH